MGIFTVCVCVEKRERVRVWSFLVCVLGCVFFFLGSTLWVVSLSCVFFFMFVCFAFVSILGGIRRSFFLTLLPLCC